MEKVSENAVPRHLELVLRVFAPALKGGSDDRAMHSAQKAGYRAIAAVGGAQMLGPMSLVYRSNIYQHIIYI